VDSPPAAAEAPLAAVDAPTAAEEAPLAAVDAPTAAAEAAAVDAPPAAAEAPPAAVDAPPAAVASLAVTAPPATLLTEGGPATIVPLLDHPLFSMFNVSVPAFARGADSPQGQAAISSLIQLIDDFDAEEEAVPPPPPPTTAPPRGQGRVLRRGLVLNPDPPLAVSPEQHVSPEPQVSKVHSSPAKKSFESATLAYSSSPRPHFPQKLSRRARSPSSGRTAALKIAKTSDPPRRSVSPRSPTSPRSPAISSPSRSTSSRSLDMAQEINAFFAAAAPRPKRSKRGGARVAPM
jgi:hypothetical protein